VRKANDARSAANIYSRKATIKKADTFCQEHRITSHHTPGHSTAGESGISNTSSSRRLFKACVFRQPWIFKQKSRTLLLYGEHPRLVPLNHGPHISGSNYLLDQTCCHAVRRFVQTWCYLADVMCSQRRAPKHGLVEHDLTPALSRRL